MVSNRKNLDRLPKLTRHKAPARGSSDSTARTCIAGPTVRRSVGPVISTRSPNGKPAVGPRRLPSDGQPPGTSDLSVNEVLLAYRRFADSYYVKNGQPTSEVDNIRLAIRPLRQLFGDILARDFGPLQLKAVRQAMVDGELCRNEINRRVRLIVRAFKWAVAESMVPPSVHHGLKAVEGLKKGRSIARESEPVKPVPDAFVDAIRPHVSRQVWAMIQLQRLTGMRPGEVCIMRTIDVDTSGQSGSTRRSPTRPSITTARARILSAPRPERSSGRGSGPS